MSHTILSHEARRWALQMLCGAPRTGQGSHWERVFTGFETPEDETQPKAIHEYHLSFDEVLNDEKRNIVGELLEGEVGFRNVIRFDNTGLSVSEKAFETHLSPRRYEAFQAQAHAKSEQWKIYDDKAKALLFCQGRSGWTVDQQSGRATRRIEPPPFTERSADGEAPPPRMFPTAMERAIRHALAMNYVEEAQVNYAQDTGVLTIILPIQAYQQHIAGRLGAEDQGLIGRVTRRR